jgi:hypothetical protein
VDKEKFCKFAGEDEIFKALLRTINMGSEGVKVVDQFKQFKDSTGDGLNGSLYRYCDGSWFRGQRSNRRRDGKGKLQLITGDLFEGSFIKGLRHGQGVMRYNFEGAKGGSVMPKFTEYKGQYKQDMKEGTATMEFVDGSRFHGYFKDNE